jgi:hypothetical protein
MDPALVTYISVIEHHLGRIADAIETLADLAYRV